MNIDDLISPEFRENAKVIGGDEIAWRGTDIEAVLKEIVQHGAVILGLESVTFRDGLPGPMVEAISDSSGWLPRHEGEAWEDYGSRTIVKSIQDIQRNVKFPFRDDVWYIVVHRQRNE